MQSRLSAVIDELEAIAVNEAREEAVQRHLRDHDAIADLTAQIVGHHVPSVPDIDAKSVSARPFDGESGREYLVSFKFTGRDRLMFAALADTCDKVSASMRRVAFGEASLTIREADLPSGVAREVLRTAILDLLLQLGRHLKTGEERLRTLAQKAAISVKIHLEVSCDLEAKLMAISQDIREAA